MIIISLRIEEKDGRLEVRQERTIDGARTEMEIEIMRGIEHILVETRREITDALIDFTNVEFLQPERYRDPNQKPNRQ